MNAKEAIAKQIKDHEIKYNTEKGWEVMTVDDVLPDEAPKQLADSLLAMKQECTECKGTGEYLLRCDGKGLLNNGHCPVCHGTGLSDLPVIAEVCEDQTLPDVPHADINKPMQIAITNAYHKAQQDMLTERVENGRPVKWIKCYVK